MGRRSKYPPDMRERAVRLVFEQQDRHESQWAAIVSIAGKMGCTPETLRKWIRQAERDTGQRPGPTTSERDRINRVTPWRRDSRQPASGDPGAVQFDVCDDPYPCEV